MASRSAAEPALGDPPLQAGADQAQAAFDGRIAGVAQIDGMAGGGGHFGNAAAHGARADHQNTAFAGQCGGGRECALFFSHRSAPWP